LSNGLRLLTLAKYGGYYFDLDFVFVRSLIKYYRNFVAAQDNYDVNNGVIHAELKSPIIELAMTNFVDNFRYRAFVIWLNASTNLCSKILFPL
jgi:lactosylceramide 4-alpha-galactosyltransferase